MLQIGNFNKLAVSRITSTGADLASESGSVFLPGRLIPKGTETGTVLNVFVYLDSEGRMVATTKRPRAVVGDFAVLTVKDTTTVGTFLDWGLEKDLLLPFGEQNEPLRRGQEVLVYIYLHENGRIAASARIDRFLYPADKTLAEGESVELILYAFSELGAKVVINRSFGGVLYNSDLYGEPYCGQLLKGYIKKIRADGKIDVTLRMGKLQDAENDRAALLTALQRHNGSLPLSDRSTPEEIAALLNMSKKSFKKGIGGLYREGLVDLTPEGVRLRETESTAARLLQDTE